MLDQHYMIDGKILMRMCNVANLTRNDTVLEIGGGTGNLTSYLRKIAKHVYVIEKDKKHVGPLTERFAHADNITLIFDDASKIDFPTFDKCISNLPYTICESLLWKFTRYKFELLVLVVPEGFADRLVGNKKSRLKLLVDAFYDVELMATIPPQAFDPPPKIWSTMIKITPKENGNFFLKELLSQYDKKTKNAVREIFIRSGLSKKEAIEQIGVKIRPALQNKKIVQLSLAEIKDIVKSFTQQ